MNPKSALITGLLIFSTVAAQAERTRIVPRREAPPAPQPASQPSQESKSTTQPISSRPGGGESQTSSGGGQRNKIVPRADNPQPAPAREYVYTGPVVAPSYAEPAGRRTRIVQGRAVTPPQSHGAIIQNSGVDRAISRGRRTEIVPGREYWHNSGRRKFVHYYDRRYHWYGFYDGPRFYWTTYYGNYWWWHDPHYGRWVYWNNGHWWWPSPAGVTYIYVNNSYEPYGEAAPPVAGQPAPAAAQPAATATGGAWTSPDKKRLVQVVGAQSDAFLYDISGGADQPKFLQLIGRQVEKVRFSGGTDGKPLQILLDQKDGTFTLLTADGEPLNSQKTKP